MNKTYINNNSISLQLTKTGVYIMDIDLKSPKNINTLLSNNKHINFTIKNNTSNEISFLNQHLQINKLDTILQNNSIIINWTFGKLFAKDISNTKTYEVYMYKLSDTTAIVKPAHKYLCSNFEHIFGFGFKCENYTNNKIIYIFTK